jgi:hypothetical protein
VLEKSWKEIICKALVLEDWEGTLEDEKGEIEWQFETDQRRSLQCPTIV